MVKEPALPSVEVPCVVCRKDFMMKTTEFWGELLDFPVLLVTMRKAG
jgi:hypothetical protein